MFQAFLLTMYLKIPTYTFCLKRGITSVPILLWKVSMSIPTLSQRNEHCSSFLNLNLPLHHWILLIVPFFSLLEYSVSYHQCFSSILALTMLLSYPRKIFSWDFPGGAVVKNPPAYAGDTGSSPGPGRSQMPQSNEARAPQLLSLHSRACEPQLLSPCATTTEARLPRTRAPQEKPPQWEAHAPQPRVAPARCN